MGVGLRVGPRVGPRVGLAVGLGSDPIGGASMASVTRDATSGIYLPANAAEWAQTLAVAGIGSGGPSHLWLEQEAAGNLADSVGVDSLVATGTAATYQSAVAGWTTKGILLADAATTSFTSVAADLPDTSVTSALLLAYVAFGAAPAISREVLLLTSTATGAELRANNTPRIQVVGGGSALGANSYINAVRPCVLKLDRAANAVLAYTDQEKISTTITNTSGKRTGIGSQAVLCGPQTHMYLAQFVGAAAEMTDAQVRKLLQTLGWTIPW